MQSIRTPEKLLAFCTVLAETCNVGKACSAIGIGRRTAYDWREADEAFAQAWDAAMKIGVTALEDEAHRRAFDGVDKPLVHLGQFTKNEDGTIATVKEYSDTLAIFLLKAHAPEKYRERSDVSVKADVTVKSLAERMRKREPLA